MEQEGGNFDTSWITSKFGKNQCSSPGINPFLLRSRQNGGSNRKNGRDPSYFFYQ